MEDGDMGLKEVGKSNLKVSGAREYIFHVY
jgi:hypothetical protein